MNYAVIMAGGCGSRLWPLSRQARPKQVLDIFGNQSLLQKSFERLLPAFDADHIFVQTNKQHVKAVEENLPLLPKENIIAEPFMRNTAGAIALAATFLTAKDPDATMAVVTADHIIEPIDIFANTISQGVEFVNENPEALVTFGICPTFPSTQYGYVHLAKPVMFKGNESSVFKVSSFKEKPDLDTAQQYIDAGSYYWNSGMFVWKAEKILNEIFTNVPGSAEPLSEIAQSINKDNIEQILEREFIKVPKISIDYAVMEQSNEVYALKMNCKWFDMGSYQALVDVLDIDQNSNSFTETETEFIDCKNNIITSTSKRGHIIAGIGIENMIIAHTDDATFICPKDKSGKIKELIEQITKNKGPKYL
ncbi:MAG: mannose-1-phosphate guanylyltransferase [Sedimentisphaeraceae bacterium JB056]